MNDTEWTNFRDNDGVFWADNTDPSNILIALLKGECVYRLIDHVGPDQGDCCEQAAYKTLVNQILTLEAAQLTYRMLKASRL